jgi:hypothetical protein
MIYMPQVKRPLTWFSSLVITWISVISVWAQPDNDAFEHRFVLAGTNVGFDAYLTDATVEPGEPDPNQPAGRTEASVWWTWTAPASGVLEIAPVNQGNANVGIALYRGSEWAGLARVTDWKVEAGQVYQIQGFQPPYPSFGIGGLRTFQLNLNPPPPNDYFTNSILLEGPSPHFEGYTYGATREPGEKARGAGTLWWHWRAPADGVAQLRTSRDGFSGAATGVFQGSNVDDLVAVPYIYSAYPYTAFDVKAGELFRVVVAANTEQDNFRFGGQIIFSPLRIESPVSGTVYPRPTDVMVKLSSSMPTAAFGLVLVTTSNGYPRIENSGFVPEMVFSNLPAGLYSIRATAWDPTGFTNYVSPEVVFRVLLPNDDFTNSIALEGTNAVASGDMRRATVEPGEIDKNGSVWWKWTAPLSGWGIIESFHGNTPDVQVFRGEQLASLTQVPRRPDLPGIIVFGFPAEPGTAYYFRATGEALQNYPSDFFRLTMAQAPLNDNFADRALLSGNQNRLEALLMLATRETGEPPLLNAFDLASVWYTWTAPAAGTLSSRMINANEWRDGVAIFSGTSLSTLRMLGSSAQVQAGQTLQIALYGNRFFNKPVGAELGFYEPPANDSFQSAQALPGSEGEIVGQNVAATGESIIWNGQYNTVWYAWIAPSNGVLSLGTTNPPLGKCCDANVDVYLGTNLDSQVRIAPQAYFQVPGTNDEPGWTMRQYDVVAGTTYNIVVFSEPVVATPFLLNYKFYSAPINDSFADRAFLRGSRGQWSGSNLFASREPGEPVVGQPEAGRSLWWQWTALTSGWVWLHVSSTNFGPLIRVYEGTALTNLSPPQFTFTNGPEELWFKAQAGGSYMLLVDNNSAGSAGGEFTVNLDLTTAQVILSEQDLDLTAPRQVRLELSKTSPDVDGELVAAQFYLEGYSNALAAATAPTFQVDTPALEAGHYRAYALATNRTGQIRRCVPCDFTLTPPNDLFARRQLLQGRTIVAAGTLAGAGREPEEPVGNEYEGGSTVWYTWQAPADGKVLAFAAPFEEPWWAHYGVWVYTGDRLADLQPVVFTGPDFGQIRFQAIRGQTYQIAVEGYAEIGFNLYLQQATVSFVSPESDAVFMEDQPIALEATTTEDLEDLAAIDFLVGDHLLGSVSAPPYRLVWTNASQGGKQVTARGRLANGDTNQPSAQIYIGVTPRNDTFATRLAVSGTNTHLLGDTMYARRFEGEAVNNSAWFTWTAPWNGLLHLSPPEGRACPRIIVFTNDAAGKPIAAAINVDNWNTTFPLALMVRAGTEYSLAINAGGAFDLELLFESSPANDDFAQRALLVGTDLQLHGPIALATAEPGEPPYADFSFDRPAHSLWWQWVAPARGSIYLTNLSSGPDGYHQLDHGFYTGTSLTNLVLLTNISRALSPPAYSVQAGQSYHLAINAPNDSIKEFNARFVFIPAPANDEFQDREVVVGRQISVSGSTLGATAESGEPPNQNNPAQHSVWYSWIAPFSGIVYYAYNSGFPFVLTTFVGGSLKALAFAPRPPDTLGFYAVEGRTYAIAVDSLDWAPGGFDFSLRLRHNTPPPNDRLADRILLPEGAAPVEGWNHYAGREWQEPKHAGRWGGRSVWYAWAPDVTGPAAIRVRADDCPLLIAVYEGTEMTNLVSVARTVPSSQIEELGFIAEKGRQYSIALDGELGASTDFDIQIVRPTVESRPYLEFVHTRPGQWSIVVRDLAWRKARLETSSDFHTWEPQASHVGGTDEWQWPLPALPQENDRTRFYRAVIID